MRTGNSLLPQGIYHSSGNEPTLCLVVDQRKSQLHHFTIGFQKPGICAIGIFSDQKIELRGFNSCVSKKARFNQRTIIPPEPARTCKLMGMTGSKKYSPVGTKAQPVWGLIFDQRKSHLHHLPLDSRNQESAQIPGFWNPMVNGANGIFSDQLFLMASMFLVC
jgi:hypothetical protein